MRLYIYAALWFFGCCYAAYKIVTYGGLTAEYRRGEITRLVMDSMVDAIGVYPTAGLILSFGILGLYLGVRKARQRRHDAGHG